MNDYSDEVLQETQNQVEEWCNAFSETDLFKNLDELVQEELWFIVPIFSEYMYNYHLQTPETWTTDALEEVIAGLFPRKISADESTFNSVEPVLTAFFQYLGDMQHIKNSGLLIKKLKKAVPVMLNQSNDPSNWGPSKQFAMAAIEHGVDLEDEQELNQFMNTYTAEKISKPIIAPPKIGRNDQCPCGSGKKYKKCCGAHIENM